MASSGKEYVRAVKGLQIPGNADTDMVAEYCEEYIDQIPILTEMMGENLFAGKIPQFIINMETAVNMLGSVYARRLEAAAELLLTEAKKGNTEACRAGVSELVAELLALSIEMQLTKHHHSEKGARAQDTAERSTAAAGDAQRVILAVDDRPEILSTVSQALKGSYKVLGATCGKMALKILEKYAPDLFLLDIEMPQMDGFQLANAIRGMEKNAKTPILFLTGNASKEYVQRALAYGAEDFIVKPVSSGALLAKIKSILS